MGKQYKELRKFDIDFIKKQKLFFIASSSGKEVNLSPKGYDCLKILDNRSLVFLSYPGSGNRTYTNAIKNGEFTLMFNSFDEKPKILKLFCRAKVVKSESEEFYKYIELFNEKKEFVRDFIEFNIYAVESSCGDGVPYMEYVNNRPNLRDWMVRLDKNNELEKYKEDHFTPPDLLNI